MLFVRMKLYEKAPADYDEYVQPSSNASYAHFTRWAFYLDILKNYKKALADFEITIESEPGHWHW